MTAFSTGDIFCRGMAAALQRHVPGARQQMHVTLEGAGHFLQEDKGDEPGDTIAGFMSGTRV